MACRILEFCFRISSANFVKYSGGSSALGIVLKDKIVVIGLKVGRIRGNLAMCGDGEEKILELILFVDSNEDDGSGGKGSREIVVVGIGGGVKYVTEVEVIDPRVQSIVVG